MIAQLLTPTHVAILLIILLLILGPKRIPESGRALGRGMREFKDAITGQTPGANVKPARSRDTASGQDGVEPGPIPIE